MADESARIAELERRLARLEAERTLARAADDVLEEALRDRWALDATLARMMPLLGEHLGARGAVVRTYDEDLRLRRYDWGAGPLDALAELVADDTAAAVRDVTGGGAAIALPLDVAGQSFGGIAIALAADARGERIERAQSGLEVFCETLDNYLAGIAHARLKHRVTSEISNALTDRVLATGIDRAIEVLRANVAFEDLVLFFHHEDDVAGTTLHYTVFEDGAKTHDSDHPADLELDRYLRENVATLLSPDDVSLTERFGVDAGFEEVLIRGVQDRRVVGRLIVGREGGAFSTFDRDLLEVLADHLRQRIVEFNREWKHLALCFPPAIVRRLLRDADYVQRWLRPRERDVAVMFTDISGFTRLSEQVMREPAMIGKLVDTWGARVVEILWETGGIFDKMVGDCVIGMWGPPFFEEDPQVLCRCAADAARRIRDYTRSLSESFFGGEAVGVATGLHYCPMYVGTFGPDEDFTGFSSGMNNTARLQGVATRDEILCMDEFVTVHGDPASFGELRDAKVKNVAEPLKFRPLV